ncbi:hypothetical protein D3C87_138500 [compost metagenome]
MIAVISHDAGGAEILSSYVQKQGVEAFLYTLEGPAENIFRRKLGDVNRQSLQVAVHQSTSILCGTSWQADIEFNAIKMARSLGKRSISFVDHWINYQDRFIRSNELVLPDEIWVGDAMALAMAKEVFPSTPVVLIDNPYVQDIRQEFAALQMSRSPSINSISVLYLCEPVSEHALLRHGSKHFWGYVEEDALRYFLSNLSVLGSAIDRIVIRAHPSEKAGKYSWVEREFDLPIEMGGQRTLVEEIVDCDLAVGCESMAMVVALMAGKKVITCIPPGGRACVLPHDGIISLQHLIENDCNK